MTTYNLFGAASPSGFTVRTDAPYSVGTEFYVTATMWITHLRWHRPDTTSPGTVTGRVYAVTDTGGTTGTAVTPEQTLTVPGAVGWGQTALATPLRIEPGTRYRVTTRAARFTQVANYFASGGPGAGGITSGPLVAPNAAGGYGGGQCSANSQSGASTAVLQFPAAVSPTGLCWFSDVVVDDVDPTGLSQRMFAGPLH